MNILWLIKLEMSPQNNKFSWNDFLASWLHKTVFWVEHRGRRKVFTISSYDWWTAL